MKKLFAIIIGSICASVLISCGEYSEIQTSQWSESTEGHVSTAETTRSEESSIKTSEQTTPVVPSENLETEITVGTEILASEGLVETVATYETYHTLSDQFVALMEYPRGGYYGEKSDIRRFNFDDYCAIRFRVLGHDDTYLGRVASIYFIQIVDAYGIDTFDSQKIYRMGYRGKLDEQLYGIPPLEPGKEYVRYYTPAELEDELLQMSLTMPVLDDVDGNTYVYGYGIDFSVFECAIEITDWEENQIYKEGKHDKIISYLKKIEKELPTFDYKCEIYAFLKELGISVD